MKILIINRKNNYDIQQNSSNRTHKKKKITQNKTGKGHQAEKFVKFSAFSV